MSKNIWVNEEQLTAIVKENGFLKDVIDYQDNGVVKIIEQPTINSRGDRPDFIVLYRHQNGTMAVYIVELKITATLKSLAQTKKYKTTIFDYIASNHSMNRVYVHEVIIARYFDADITPYFEGCHNEISFYRIEQNTNGDWFIDLMDYETPEVSLEFINKMDFFGGEDG